MGEIAFLPGHQPVRRRARRNRTRVFQTDGTIQDIAIHRGFVEVSGNPTKVSILSDTAELAQDIDVERAKEALERHQHMLRDQSLDDTMIEIATAGRDLAEGRSPRHRHDFHCLIAAVVRPLPPCLHRCDPTFGWRSARFAAAFRNMTFVTDS